MKIALVRTYFDMTSEAREVKPVSKIVKLRAENYPPLGLCYIASYLMDKGIRNVEVIDCVERNYTAHKCAQYIVENSFDIVGISLTSFDLFESKKLIDEIRLRSGNIKIVLGGVHITHCPQAVKLLNADFGIRGDGEESFFKFLTDFKHSIPGLVYMEGNELKYNKPAKLRELDSLPFPLILDYGYKFPLFTGKMYTMVTSRGCVYDCIFCGLFHKREYTKRSPENVFEEMRCLEKKNFKYIDFKDDCFSMDKERVKKLCKLIIKNKLKVFWGAETRADAVDYQLLRLMKRANCHNLRFGIESGVDRIRNDIIGKNLHKNDIFKAIRYCKQLNIRSGAYLLFGSPTETVQEMKESVSFMRRLRPDYLDVSLAVPIVGSRLYEVSLKENKIPKDILEKVIKGISKIPVYIPDGVTLAQMRKLQRLAFFGHYFKLSTIMGEIKNIKGIRDLLSKLQIAVILLSGRR